jgi:hypothetical protein
MFFSSLDHWRKLQRRRLLERVRQLPPEGQDLFFQWTMRDQVRQANAALWGLASAILAVIAIVLFLLSTGD